MEIPGILAAELFQPDEVRLDSERLLSGMVQPVSDSKVIIYKPREGAFVGTPLESRLREPGVNTLVFTGCAPELSAYFDSRGRRTRFPGFIRRAGK